MTEILEISSDSDNSIILEEPKQSLKFDDEDDDLYIPVTKRVRNSEKTSNLAENLDDILGSLSQKYNFRPEKSTSETSELSDLQSLSNKQLENDINERKKLDERQNGMGILYQKQTSSSTSEASVSFNNNELDNLDLLSNKERKQLEKNLQKQKKLEERQRKKETAEREKAIKQALATANKNLKPDECLKFITVHFDLDFENEPYGQPIMNHLLNSEISYKTLPQIFPNIITWTRKNQNHVMNADNQLTLHCEEVDTNQILLIMSRDDFMGHISNKTLITHIQSLKSIFNNKMVYLLIFGKKIAKKEVEMTLTELQILCSCSHRFISDIQEIVEAVYQFTKSVAQIPYKQRIQEKAQKTEWYALGDNKDTVKVDKDGNGLQRLWNQMLTMFPLARLEIAEAITSKYPTLSSLILAYQNCSIKEGQELLQDIPIRRAAGPLTSVRRIGPELSKKIYNVYTSINGEDLL